MMEKLRYARLSNPKGNEADGYSVNNDFEKVYLKYEAQGLFSQVDAMMDDWIDNRVQTKEAHIFKDIKKHHLIKK